ncbi:uncharacterized protein LOC131224340 [Magnolia sinica]|uniref:uncharacterized protein LOC131224340 n=1 Tax=Magnolia sinica TaxID=86752 RepID=UPI00265AA169|nr:uncharacterized protein LOC131224340 [Magnolia sinica]
MDFIKDFNIQLSMGEENTLLGNLSMEPSLLRQIIETQEQDEELQKCYLKAQENNDPRWDVGSDGGIRCRNRICIPNKLDIKQAVLNEAHRSKLTIHPGRTKIYQDVKRHYWWNNMKREIAAYVAKCLTC